MTRFECQVYIRQAARIIQGLPILGLCFSASLGGNAVSVALACVAVILGTIGVWLPAIIYALHRSLPFLFDSVLDVVNHSSAIDGSMLIIVPSLISPCAILLFGPWGQAERIGHQVGLLCLTLLLYGAAFIVVITQLSGGVADKLLMLRLSWWMLVASVIILYFYELLARMNVNILETDRAERDDLMRRTVRQIGSDD